MLRVYEGGGADSSSGRGSSGTVSVDVTCGTQPRGAIAIDATLVGATGPLELHGSLLLGGTESR